MMTSDHLIPYQNRIEDQLSRAIATLGQTSKLPEIMSYACLGGGKRLRAALAYLSVETLGLDLEDADTTAMAVELIHAYSLIHDDLPAMDDDPLRRGKASTHIAFGEAEAILAGDALQALAFQVIADDTRLSAPVRLALVRSLAQAVGANGMVGGQALDMASEHRSVDIDTLTTLHRLKTGALITFAIGSGGLHGRCKPEHAAALTEFGRTLGLAFQVQDDILDETSNTATLGKQQGADKAQAKSTFVSILGLAGAKDQLAILFTQAIEGLHAQGLATEKLLGLVEYVRERSH
jgi:geranylgeranyl diphosphate synthase type II